MKPRLPDSLEHAVTLHLAILGDVQAAQIIGRTASLLHKASDPDQDATINCKQGLALDKACLELTGEEPPIFRWWRKELNFDCGKITEVNVIACVLGLQEQIGNISKLVREVTAPQSTDGPKLSHNEALAVMEEIDKVEREASAAKALLKGYINHTPKG